MDSVAFQCLPNDLQQIVEELPLKREAIQAGPSAPSGITWLVLSRKP